jgi:hypothetical protein
LDEGSHEFGKKLEEGGTDWAAACFPGLPTPPIAAGPLLSSFALKLDRLAILKNYGDGVKNDQHLYLLIHFKLSHPA